MESEYLEKVIASAPTFYRGYIVESSSMSLQDLLSDQIPGVRSLFGITMYHRRDHRYAEGKWTPTEILGHLVDAERIFQYRALRFARNDKTELPGFEEDDYVGNTNFTARGIESILDEFEFLRRSGIELFRSFSEEELWRSGPANGANISVIALFHAIAGHYVHHMRVVRELYR